MMHFVNTHHLQPKNKLQEDIILEVEKWNGTLIDDNEAKTCFIERMSKAIDFYNDKNPRCKPCLMARIFDKFIIKTGGEEDAFATFVLLKVKATYDGITRWKEEEGGAE